MQMDTFDMRQVALLVGLEGRAAPSVREVKRRHCWRPRGNAEGHKFKKSNLWPVYMAALASGSQSIAEGIN